MSDSVKWYWLTLAAITCLLIYLLSPVLMPFLAGALLAYMANPIVSRLARFKIPRSATIIFLFIVFACAFLMFIVLLIPMLVDQLRWFFGKIPAMINWVQTVFVPKLNQWLEIDIHLDFESIKRVILGHWQQVSDVVASVVTTVTSSGAAIFAWFINLILIPLVTFYLLRDWPQLWKTGRDLLPRHVEPVVVELVGECNQVLGAFFRGQLLVVTILAVYYSVAFYLMHLNVALLLGLIAGVFSFIPVVGTVIGIASGMLATFFQFYDLWHLGIVFVIFVIGHLLETAVLTPLIVGDQIGLHPVAVIFSILAGGQLFGFVGVLLALPTAAVIVVLMRYLKTQYQSSRMYHHAARKEPS